MKPENLQFNITALLFAVAAVGLPFFLLHDDWVGYLFLYLSFGVILLSKECRRNKGLLSAAVVSLILHHGLAFFSSYFGDVAGGANDPETFHITASSLAFQRSYLSFRIGHNLYMNFLSILYQFFGASKFLGQETSILVYSVSCLFFTRLIHLMGNKRFQTRLFLFYGILPSAIIHRTLTQRESLQSLFFIASAYFLVKLREQAKLKWVLCFLGSSILLGVLHHGLLLYSVVQMFAGLYWGLRVNEFKISLQNKLFWALLVVGIFLAWLWTTGGDVFYCIKSFA